ncbi:integral membrane protein [Podospora fimiseda]|uniref:Integral membrane protein n=1 Tax=Podospora fimiseda TaxID=252190 RepID=A0AAN7BMS4_9PEZI|nr:integral membrane protein [Podospora fimiseda]
MTKEHQFSEEYIRETRGPMMIGICIAFAVLTTIFVPLRFWARRIRAATFGFDDVLIIAAYIVNLACCALGILMVKIGGVGQHADVLAVYNPKALTGWAKVLLAFEYAYFTAVALPKLSILCLYLRVLNWNHGPWRWATFVLFGLVTATWLSMMVAVCFQCQPLPFWWDKKIVGGKCFNVQTFFHAQSIPGFVLDFLIMALPLRTIWDLKLSMAKKFALVLVFVVASFGVVASIIRATIFFNNSAFDDRTWASAVLCGWSVVEAGCYIIANCLSHLRPLISHFAPQWLKDTIASVTQRNTTGPGSHVTSRTRKGVIRKAEDDGTELIFNPHQPSTQTWPLPGVLYPSQSDVSQQGAWVQSRSETYVRIQGEQTDQQFGTDGAPGVGVKKDNGRIQVTTEVTTEIRRKESAKEPLKDAGRFV